MVYPGGESFYPVYGLELYDRAANDPDGSVYFIEKGATFIGFYKKTVGYRLPRFPKNPKIRDTDLVYRYLRRWSFSHRYVTARITTVSKVPAFGRLEYFLVNFSPWRKKLEESEYLKSLPYVKFPVPPILSVHQSLFPEYGGENG